MTVSIEKPLQPSASKVAFQKFSRLLKSAFKPALKVRPNAKSPLTASPKAAYTSASAPSVKAQKSRPPRSVQGLTATLEDCGLYL